MHSHDELARHCQAGHHSHFDQALLSHCPSRSFDFLQLVVHLVNSHILVSTGHCDGERQGLAQPPTAKPLQNSRQLIPVAVAPDMSELMVPVRDKRQLLLATDQHRA